MKAEIIAVGTELLLGQIVNTNAQYLSQGLAELGIDVYFQTVVGDNEARVMEAFRLASTRADLVICTGGIGPTQDDLTKDVLGKFVGRELEMHEASMTKITEMFASRGIHMVESNKRQALMLAGSDPLLNENGLAVGNCLTNGDTHYVVLPGPPREMKPMFANHAVPWLRGVMGDVVPLQSRMLKFTGIGESALEDRLIDLIEQQTDPTIAPYAKEGEVAIRLTTRAWTQEDANVKFHSVEAEIRNRLSDHLYADQNITLEEAVLALLEQQNKTFTAAESCSGGLLGEMVTAIPGSSKTFKGGVICYTNELKHKLVGVPMNLLEGSDAPGAVSAEVAESLAAGMKAVTGSDFAISITGVAGPSESEGKPVGLVYVGIADDQGGVQSVKLKLIGNRDGIRLRAVKSAMYQLWKRLANK
ncbi:competence/damage-inducible protein A [Paenibacillus sp. N1-5-1-14]|uniref:competence/damage-inducible protein A n=1 Tax=Paenibacillus radicibacter TaxID=2972488 RepID=UPI002159917D|nr:competence/damage-inducible protein A [Paenibacillus radicibacter]MCR8642118.1 competence/damage-inducible protein A [Paenibacillus radicibacter]